MYVIGVEEQNLIRIQSRTRLGYREILREVEKVMYGCGLARATFFPNYELATEAVEKIKYKKKDIVFENDDFIGYMLDVEYGKNFDVEKLKVYELVFIEE